MHTAGMIQATDLGKIYHRGGSRQAVLAGLEFSVGQGECVALLGRSGSGKSTLLNLLAGIDRPDTGRVEINGQCLSAMNERERTLFRRRHIGFVYQFFNLIPTLSAAENVRLPMELNAWPRAHMDARVMTLLRDLGLDGRGGDYPEQLSGGEQQRVAIARALAHEPGLILADEPTGNLDAATGRNMLELLLRLTRDSGNTLLVVTHSLEVARAADRMLVQENGQVRAGGVELAW